MMSAEMEVQRFRNPPNKNVKTQTRYYFKALWGFILIENYSHEIQRNKKEKKLEFSC